ncbi:hypothetical protein BT93_L4238 [Corymbia citriodora subsp. variegata]|uniref:Uncharacterized protein n=1 Tax=Corymbia citriodora subsp. variegata TaxID=360336 RepID=A0A8T0CG25_CORYI|nr:hypothetical protein BT93_L4238 [Corymbia citriodora subsp. variegata]
MRHADHARKISTVRTCTLSSPPEEDTPSPPSRDPPDPSSLSDRNSRIPPPPPPPPPQERYERQLTIDSAIRVSVSSSVARVDSVRGPRFCSVLGLLGSGVGPSPFA